jgi:fructose-1,6-bisphosphatase II
MADELSEVGAGTVARQLSSDPGRNLALELVRVTEAAAIAAGRQMGRGDKERVDQAAVDAMRPVLQSVQMDGIVVIGEGEKDEAPMLYNGERVGSGVPPEVDLAVDPVDGTTLTAKSLPDAIAVIAIAERGTMFDPGPCVYMEKLAVAGDVADVVELDAPIADNLRRIAQRRGKRAEDITVAVLERPRHEDLVGEILATGARVKYLRDGDVAGAILAADETSTVDACVGIGGTPEGVITACALRCLDGQILGRLYPRDDTERNAALEQGYDLDRILRTEDLVSGQDIFFAATGVTGGELLEGVRYTPRRIITQSLSMRSKSGAVRIVEGRHHPERSNLIRAGSTEP